MKYFVVSDVHSFYEPLMKALNEQGFDKNNEQHIVVVCGDLFDRGFDTIKCYEFAKSLAEQKRLIYIRGNHEDLFIDCINEILTKSSFSLHHEDNGTIRTLQNFTAMHQREFFIYKSEFCRAIQPLLDFIVQTPIDYAEIGDYVFTHGWIPCSVNRVSRLKNQYQPIEDWRNGNWSNARWVNGMEAWQNGIRVPNKTIVCGHFHTSWARKHILHNGMEWPNKWSTNPEHRVADFTTFKDDGIIALDACTAFTGFVNCLTIEI